MINFLSKSSEKDFQKILEVTLRKLDSIINEQKAQRVDIAEVKLLIIKYHGDSSPNQEGEIQSEE